MRPSHLLYTAASCSAAAIKGFNYGATNPDGSVATQQNFQSLFAAAQNLAGAPGFASARLYTTIQGGTANTPTSAIPAAIATKTKLLLGLWASAGQATIDNELAALVNAAAQYGSAFTDLVVGISVGSEDLYRNSATGVLNKAGIGADPAVVAGYIYQTKGAIAGTSLAGKPVGHVDTWNDFVNGSNAAVIQAADFLGMDAYPYFETTKANSITNANATFFAAYDATVAAAAGKPVWVTETGWPLSGPTANLAVPGVQNAKSYWDAVGCALFDDVNTWWYTLYDGTPSPSFGVVGSSLSASPLFDLSCPN